MGRAVHDDGADGLVLKKASNLRRRPKPIKVHQPLDIAGGQERRPAIITALFHQKDLFSGREVRFRVPDRAIRVDAAF